MRILIAPDKFKGTLTAVQAADAIAAGVRQVFPEAEMDLCPMADGGEGTVAAMVSAAGGTLHTHRVTGPLPEMRVDAVFGILPDKTTVVIEMAAASGLALLSPADRNPLNTTTFGTGELLLQAARMGCTHAILGIGGSATSDAGIGCAQGAGLTVLTRDGSPVAPTEPLTARDLPDILTIKHARGSPVDRLSITVACDVTNPLFGPNGAAYVYAPQKGAAAEDVTLLDEYLRDFATRTGRLEEADTPGAGAAGGLGFGLLAFFNARLQSGFELISQAVNLPSRIAQAELVITAEGRLDATSLQGKTPTSIARLCAEQKIPCIALAGSVDGSAASQLAPQFHSIHTLVPPASLEEAMANPAPLLTAVAARAVSSR